MSITRRYPRNEQSARDAFNTPSRNAHGYPRNEQARVDMIAADRYKDLIDELDPVFTDAGSYAVTIAENVASGSVVGSVSAADETGSSPYFTIIGGSPDSTLFAINSATGNVTLTRSGLEYDVATRHFLHIRASEFDGRGTDVATLTINITSVN